MTECEICGAGIRGKVQAQYISIGTSKLRVCNACARYGTVVVEEKQKAKLKQFKETKERLYEEMDLDIEEELDEDYGMNVRVTREKAGLKQEDLAKRINEKQSLLRKIEHGEIIPDEEVRRKIERVLNSVLKS